MVDERLTRTELAWLLAQEARGAAKALRDEVSQLKAPAPTAIVDVRVPSLEGNLNALEDAINALSDLQQQGAGTRRGRIDVASLVGTLAPQARMALAPGTGTEVYADESDLRRMLHVLLCATSGSGDTTQNAALELEIRGEGDFVRVSVPLGPDQSATAELERRWLSRMAMRLGGRLELSHGEQCLFLPTGGAHAKQEVDALRRELDQAKQLGEAYARELAEVFASSVAPPPPDLVPSRPVGNAHLAGLRSVGAAIVRLARPLVDGLHADVEALRLELGAAAPLPRSLALHTTGLDELVAELTRVAACPVDEARSRVDLASLCRSVASEADERAARHGVTLHLEVDDAGSLMTSAAALTLLVRSLLDHAIAATPREARIELSATTSPGVSTLRCRDGGPAVPARAHEDLLRHRVDPTSLGRPAGVALLTIDAVATLLDAAVLLEDGEAGGFVVAVSLPSLPD